jgi:phage gp29-like protein
LKKLAPRPATTVQKITYDDNGGPVSIIQGAIRADGKVEPVEIPIAKLIIFTLGKKGGNLTGKSLLRTAYQSWYYKNHLYKIDAIQKERHGIGVPKARMQPGFTDKDKKAAQQLVKNLRTNEEAGMVLPPTMDVEFAELKNNPVDALESAVHHNGMIMLNVMAQFLLLGVEAGSGGGRATSGSHMDMFMKSLRYIAELICQYINLYLIPSMVVYNFPTTNFPMMKVRRLGEARDLQVWASGISALIDKGGITVDLETEQWLREQVDMPRKQGDRPDTISSEQNITDILEAGGVKSDERGRTSGPSGAGNSDPQKSTIGPTGNVPGGTGRIGAHPQQP